MNTTTVTNGSLPSLDPSCVAGLALGSEKGDVYHVLCGNWQPLSVTDGLSYFRLRACDSLLCTACGRAVSL